MLIFLVICLIVSLLSLEVLIVSGFRSVNHRLLPLLIGLIALYDFYLIAEYKEGTTNTILLLKDLLIVQVINLVIYFIVDFTELHLKKWINFIIISGVLIMDFIICTKPFADNIYRMILISYINLSMVLIIITMVIASFRHNYSKRVRHNNLIVFFILAIPALGLLPNIFFMPMRDNILAGGLMIVCIILDWLFLTDRLRDVRSYLKEELFATLDVPAVLFDSELSYIDASERAKLIFPEMIDSLSKNPDNYNEKTSLKEFRNQGGHDEQQFNGRYYSVTLQEAFYNKKMQGYILRFFDITEQKMETETAIEMSRKKSEFLANMSHDLRSPLHAILGGSEIILSRADISLYVRMMLNRIHESGENLLQIVNSILDFSKLESGNIELHPTRYNFKNIIEQQAQMGFVNLMHSNVKLSINITNSFPEYLYGDELRVRQIIQNILSNAIKFTNNGSITCNIKTEITFDYKVKITYSVEDTGIGMTEEQLKTIFGHFVSYADEIREEGSGLGLTIVRKLSEMMGGYAKATSVKDEGSVISAVFYQELPNDINKNEPPLHAPMTLTELDQVSINKAWNTTVEPSYEYPDAKVLIVDDMEINRVILKELIQPWNVKMDFAENGLEATKKVMDEKYDLIILDQMMPVMTGTEAADIIASITPTPMILVTANITDIMRKESQSHGLSDYLPKPVDIGALKTVLEKYLPENLQRPYSSSNLNTKSTGQVSKSYVNALSSFLTEMRQLYKVLPEYAQNDINLLRNKVHGIKGVCKQLGKMTLAFSSEIMEMAATTCNLTFIDSFFNTFYSDLELTIAETDQELIKLKKELEVTESQNNDDTVISVSSETIDELLNTLKAGLDSYDLDVIDNTIIKLRMNNLESELLILIDSIEGMIDELEYDDALDALMGYLG